MTTLEMVREAADLLGTAGVERPRWTAEQLAAAVLGCEPPAFVLEPPAVAPEQAEEVRRRAVLRAQGVPLQHLTGIAGFFGHDFLVRPGVFIPRPETERLVETAAQEVVRHPGAVVLDVGTGTGAIAISLTLAAPVGTMLGLDMNTGALALAAENARRLGAASRVRWARADLLSACGAGRADVIVANLPYIPSSALPDLPREIRHDPSLALDGGPDGLTLIRRLMAQAARVLRRPGTLLLEVGAGQADLIVREAGQGWGHTAVIADDTGIARVVMLRRGTACP
ncbi:MAG: protein-(glutamine-N5) methyltransferase, release factor-specific [Omnitrophica WOR_2 bacterium RIFCSPHIGHO2_02_FULL_68_15]|nr:MAG: protein-(glutamine-N5) methyltransferase, release factor-specific [Omnitrophica WOR_2 bacterium RIFCSPHIGHO2_02_FULL_68_15]